MYPGTTGGRGVASTLGIGPYRALYPIQYYGPYRALLLGPVLYGALLGPTALAGHSRL